MALSTPADPKLASLLEWHKTADQACLFCWKPWKDEDKPQNHVVCGHAWHEECIQVWLQHSSPSTCPICQALHQPDQRDQEAKKDILWTQYWHRWAADRPENMSDSEFLALPGRRVQAEFRVATETARALWWNLPLREAKMEYHRQNQAELDRKVQQEIQIQADMRNERDALHERWALSHQDDPLVRDFGVWEGRDLHECMRAYQRKQEPDCRAENDLIRKARNRKLQALGDDHRRRLALVWPEWVATFKRIDQEYRKRRDQLRREMFGKARADPHVNAWFEPDSIPQLCLLFISPQGLNIDLWFD